jgi:hypothetical protein
VKHLKASKNAHDWLGNGIYFWENDPRRALEFATEGMTRPVTRGKITKPFVVGAAIDLGFCLNLLERECLQEIAQAYVVVEQLYQAAGEQVPENRGADRLQRNRDRLVLEMVHELREKLAAGDPTKYQPYTSVRGAFQEGDEPYPGAGFKMKNHIQLAIRDPACIKGYFRPFEN